MKELVIFDLDGTLLNTLGDLAISTNYALKKFGYPEHEQDEYRYMVGNGITKLIERALPEDARTEDQIRRVRTEFVSYYSAHKTDLTQPYPGMPELLETLKRKGLVLAVASNKYQEATRELIWHYFKDGTFEVILGQRETRPTKPDPGIVNEIMTVVGVEKESTLYVGDSCIDMQTAINAGVTAVGVSWGFRPCDELEENGAMHIVYQPAEILDLLI